MHGSPAVSCTGFQLVHGSPAVSCTNFQLVHGFDRLYDCFGSAQVEILYIIVEGSHAQVEILNIR